MGTQLGLVEGGRGGRGGEGGRVGERGREGWREGGREGGEVRGRDGGGGRERGTKRIKKPSYFNSNTQTALNLSILQESSGPDDLVRRYTIPAYQ